MQVILSKSKRLSGLENCVHLFADFDPLLDGYSRAVSESRNVLSGDRKRRWIVHSDGCARRRRECILSLRKVVSIELREKCEFVWTRIC